MDQPLQVLERRMYTSKDRKGIASYVLFGFHSGLYLLPRLPVTLRRLFEALRPDGSGIRDGDLLGFGELDAGFRWWYGKMADDQGRFGRLGFVWSDGFGIPFNPRFFSNFATYRLYGLLGSRWYTMASISAFLLSALLVLGLTGHWLHGLAVLALILGSPLFIGSQIHLGKPELLWWALFPLLLFAAWQNHWLLAGLLFSAIAFANFAVAFMVGLSLLLIVLLFLPPQSALLALVAGMLPGLVKTALRLIPFFRAGWLQRLLQEQSDATGSGERSFLDRLRGLLSVVYAYYAILYSVALLLIVIAGGLGVRFVILGLAALAIYVLGQRLFYLNDPQSFWMWHLGLLVGMLAVAPSWVGVLGMIGFVYMDPRVVGCPSPFRSDAQRTGTFLLRAGAQGEAVRRALAGFPYLAPLSRERVTAPLRKLYCEVPPQSRILMESHSSSRDFGGYRGLVNLSEEVLADRGISIIPDEYTRQHALQFYRCVLSRYNAQTSVDHLIEIHTMVGAQFALAYTPEFVRQLEEAGFLVVAVLRPVEMEEQHRRLLRLPEQDLTLLRLPILTGVLTPPAAFWIERNSLSWLAEAGTSYLVRFAHHPHFTATQSDGELPIFREAAAGTDLVFMRVDARQDGRLTVRFRPSIL